jgi:hypothetical protein
MTRKNTFAAIVLVIVALAGWFVASKRDGVSSHDHGIAENGRHSYHTSTGGETRTRSSVRDPDDRQESRQTKLAKAQELLKGVIEASSGDSHRGLSAIGPIRDLITGMNDEELRVLTKQLIDSNNGGIIDMLSLAVMERFAKSKGETGELCLWLKNLPPSLGRSKMLQALGTSHTDPRGTDITRLMDEFPDRRDKLEVLTGLVGRLASSSVENAIAVYEEHAPKDSDPERLGEILSCLSKNTDFLAVIDRLQQSDSANQGAAVGGVIARWAEYEPEVACKYAYANSAVENDQIREAFQVWAQRDPRSAGHWLDGLAASGKKDAMVSEFVRSRARMAPAASWKQSYQISDPELREKTLSEIYDKWRGFSPEDADQALQTHKAENKK